MANITMEMLIYDLTYIAKENAPVRSKPLGAVGRPGTRMYSPYPGNLKNNGIFPQIFSPTQARLVFGGPVGYADYANRTSFKPQYQEKTLDDFIQKLITKYGGVVK